MTIDTTLPASNPLRFKKNLFDSCKNDNNDHIKFLNRKIMQNEAQYDLGRKASKISELLSNSLDKYEY